MLGSTNILRLAHFFCETSGFCVCVCVEKEQRWLGTEKEGGRISQVEEKEINVVTPAISLSKVPYFAGKGNNTFLAFFLFFEM